MSRVRKVLVVLGAVLLVAALALGVLRWQADRAASDYASAVKAHGSKYGQIYRTTPELAEATAELNTVRASLPKGIARVPRAKKIGLPLGTVYVATTRILRREIADAPEVKSVPLGARLSRAYEQALADARSIDRGYAKGLALSVAAAQFYPDLGTALDRLTRVTDIEAAGTRARNVPADLLGAQRSTVGGAAGADRIAGVKERLENDETLQQLIAETPLPSDLEPERAKILATIAARAQAARQVQAAALAEDQAAYDAATKAYDAGSKARYVESYLRLMRRAVALDGAFRSQAKALRAQAEAL